MSSNPSGAPVTAGGPAPFDPAFHAPGDHRAPTDLAALYGPAVKLNADGSVNCRLCGFTITFLPESFPAEDLPAGAPRTVNHTGCSKAKAEESPAAPDMQTGYFETVNVIDQLEVAEFYKDKAAFSKARGGK